MAKKPSPSSVSAPTAPDIEAWSQVTLDQLVDQFDKRTVTRGERYQQSRQVRELALLADGALIAFVEGSESESTAVLLPWSNASGAGLALVGRF